MSEPRLVPHDPALPQLARLFDTAYVRQRLQHLAGGTRAAVVDACEIERVKYRPRRACVVGYKLRVREATSGAEQDRRIALCMYPADDASARYAKAAKQWGKASVDVAAVSMLKDLHALAWTFPHDRKLPALALVADDAWAAAAVPQLVRGRWGAAYRARQNTHTIQGYFPEHSCTFSEKVILSPVYGVGERLWTLFGKLRADDAGAASFTNMRTLWESPARLRGLVAYAQPLAYDAQHQVLWQEGIAGTTLDQALQGQLSDAMFGKIGAAIAALHTTPLDCAGRLDLAEVNASLLRAQDVLTLSFSTGALGAALVAGVDRLQTRLERSSRAIDFSGNATLHGDLHSNNILLTDNTVALIDVDALQRGPALADLGSLVAELLYRACVACDALPLAAVAATVAAYQRCVPWRIAPDELAWFTAAALLRERAYRCVASLKPGRMQALPRLIEVAERVLSGSIGLCARVTAPYFAPAQAVGA